MKILIAQFVIESNANIPYKSRLENFNLLFGEDCIREMRCEDVFGREGVEIILSLIHRRLPHWHLSLLFMPMGQPAVY